MRRSIGVSGIMWVLGLLCALSGYAQISPGPMSKEHGMLSGPEHCNDCHDLGRGKPEFKCLSCHSGIPADQKSGRHLPLGDAITSGACTGCHPLHNAGGTASGGTEKKDRKAASPHGSAGIACRNCHTATSFKPIRPYPDFAHSQTRFPLRGMHVGLDCRQCHAKLVFTSIGKQCADCHADFHRRQMGSNCEQCHTVRGWGVTRAAVNNHENRFPLLGAHASVDCESCHKSAAAGPRRGLNTDCVSCHQRDHAAAKSVDHQAAGFPTTCQSCHTAMDSWVGAKFDHGGVGGFALTGGHAQLDCTACHENRIFTGTSSDCANCHATDYSAAANPDHTAAGFSRSCQTCHSTAGWAASTFDHRTSAKFTLTGAHAAMDCQACHKNGKYAGTPTSCYSCHSADFSAAKSPVHASGTFSTDCTACHTSASWSGGKFDHNLSSFRLTGAHADAQCATCHNNKIYAGLSTDCASCHLTTYNGTTNPSHGSAGFSRQCSTCHNSTTSWAGATFNHGTTAFALSGAHNGVQCATCHKNNVFAGLPKTCASCHLTAYNGTTKPNHGSAGFSQDCSQCHNSLAWQGGTSLNHNTQTKFPLTGAHSGVQCTICHKNNVFAGTSTACVSCHLATYNGTTNPNHASAGFSQQCSTCHNSTTSWASATFNHSTTTFPLTGAHTGALCTACHKNNLYDGLPSTCVSCHLADYNGVTNPNHASAGFSQQCSTCHHSTTSWAGATFNHGTTTFPLTGAHSGALCTTCHKNNVYDGLPSTCVSCHLADYNGVTSPNHASAGFPQQCSTCHNSTTSWAGATFNHSTTTFPLTGAHTGALCTTCHKNNVYDGLPSTCVSCHLTTYNGTTNPNHVQSGFPQDCSLCHSTASFSGAIFNHGTTPFPLKGAHITVSCTLCHKNNVYAGLANACSSCHLTDYNGTTNPNHTAAGFPQLCSTCHSTTAWAGATFNHTATPFPLTGAHTSVQCNLCHINNKYVGTPTDCYSCHSAEYKNTTNPGHAAAGFPTTCTTCHSTTQWTGATFNHTWFPMRHGGATRTCSDCHTNPSNYTIFTCTTCHTKAQMDSKHAGRSGYVYNSANCYQCHRSGGN